MGMTKDELAAAVRALWATAPPVARPPGSPDKLAGGATKPTRASRDQTPTEPTTIAGAEPTATTPPPLDPPAAPPAGRPEPIPSKPPTRPALSAGQSLSGRCSHHGDRRRWLDLPAPGRAGWIRTTCDSCGGFVGYRPAAAD